jgi:hypothetical protein
VSYDKINNVVNAVISRILARAAANFYSNKFSRMTKALTLIACDCGSKSDNCFGTPETIIDSTCRIDPQTEGSCSVVSNVTLSGNSSVEVTVGNVAPLYFLDNSTTNSTMTKRSVSNIYAVIQSNGQIVGQLVGSGQSVSGVGSQFTICLPTSLTIAVDSIYTVPDFVQLNGNSLSTPMGLQVTIIGTDYCAVVSDGTYFPILKVQPQTVTSIGSFTTTMVVTTTISGTAVTSTIVSTGMTTVVQTVTSSMTSMSSTVSSTPTPTLGAKSASSSNAPNALFIALILGVIFAL